ncbi:LamG-like jellyroll fold domain-containing protein [Cryobacterium sp. TMT3-29-2]|uniref:LamG-like jellyroll fold domain-containing protein n=1 Tax=Cryobacterium sp. TMT3-29-2 TaxID=2555867 RepID=UPI00107404BA|nr:LamG-like jellyroll fold domain-containing protein [Cryobacterium sp. TMT3-29-2]TFC83440.1 DNRLRE domain-containing protein [Cryobacterium sp. TMT3-29-2]
MRKLAAILTTVAVVAGLAMASSVPQSASALSTGVAFSADNLSTWQTNGVVYGVGTVHGKVVAGGTFSQIRPPSGGVGVARNQGTLAIFNAETGAPDSCQFAMTLNGATPTVRSVIASPDGNTIYIGGNFSTVGGVNAARVAAIDPVACTVKPFRVAGVSSFVFGMAATSSTLYLAGEFQTVGGQTRQRFAAVNATSGALLPWAPAADTIGRAVAVSPDRTRVAIGGDFFTVNNQDSHSIAVVDATTGANVRNYPLGFIPRTSVTKTLWSDGTSFYGGNEGTGGGVFDGRFAINWGTLDQTWRDTCLGATQAVLEYQGTLYSANHAHDCSSNNAFPDGKRVYLTAQNTTDAALLGWFPTANDGTGEGIGPRALTIATGATTGKKYLWYGGEFTVINGTVQQGLTRFGPDDVGAPPTPVVAAEALTSGANQIRFRTVVDPDDSALTYNVYRNGAATPIWTGTANSLWWTRPQVTVVDTNVTAGTNYTYRVTANDGVNTSPLSASVSARAVTKGVDYPSQVIQDGAKLYWRLDEVSGPWAQDKSGATVSGLNGLYKNGVTYGAGGAIAGDADTSVAFNGTDGYVWSDQQAAAPTTYTIETWIKTTTTRGGKIIGFGNGRPHTGNGGTRLSGSYDKHIYMDNQGRLTFGVYIGRPETIRTASSYNDDAWHHIVATQSGTGMKMFVDGVRVGQNATSTSQQYSGNWHVGGDNLNGWPNQPSSAFFGGQIDDTAVYASALSAAQIAQHYTLAGGTPAVPPTPTDAYGARIYTDEPDVYWRLDEASGNTAKDSSSNGQSDGEYGTAVQLQQPKAIQVGSSVQASGTQAGGIATKTARSSFPAFSTEAWFKTGSSSGGKIVGFENAATGQGSNYDKQIYLTNSGSVVFGVYAGGFQLIESPPGFNDNTWHHVVGTQGPDGMRLYLDGLEIGSNPTTVNQAFDGYWRAGGGNLNSWPSQPASPYFAGLLDEVAVYPSALNAAAVTAHYELGSNTTPDSIAPSAPTGLTSTVSNGSVALAWTPSTDNVGVTGYSVHRGSAAGFVADATNKIADVTNPSYTDSGLADGTYHYVVFAYDARGNASPASASVPATVSTPDTVVPSVPTGLTATVSGSAVSLAWTASTDNVAVTGYSVHRGSTAEFVADASSKIADVSGASYSDPGLAAGVYFYKVVASDAAGNVSAASGAAEATVQAAPVEPVVLTAGASEDAMVYQVLPTTNFGSNNQLSSRGAGTSLIESYLKFAIPAAPAGTVLSGATLRVRTSTDSTAASVDAQMFKLLSGNWTEGTVNWNNRPTGLGADLGSLTGASATNTAYSVPLDAAQLRTLTGSTLSVALVSAGSDNLRLWSTNSTSATYRPLLTLTYTAG